MTDREREHTQAPDAVLYPEPGTVMWAEVWRDGRRVGAVWIATTATARPRAGILNDPACGGDLPFQHDLHPAALTVSANPEVDAAGWLAHLAATRDGNHGRVIVGEARRARSLAAVRQRMREPL